MNTAETDYTNVFLKPTVVLCVKIHKEDPFPVDLLWITTSSRRTWSWSNVYDSEWNWAGSELPLTQNITLISINEPKTNRFYNSEVKTTNRTQSEAGTSKLGQFWGIRSVPQGSGTIPTGARCIHWLGKTGKISQVVFKQNKRSSWERPLNAQTFIERFRFWWGTPTRFLISGRFEICTAVTHPKTKLRRSSVQFHKISLVCTTGSDEGRVPVTTQVPVATWKVRGHPSLSV